MTPSRPYLLRAINEWILDNDLTPFILVDAEMEGVTVPDQFVEYLASIGNIEEMINMGIMTKKVGDIVKVALADVPAESGAPPAREHAAKRVSMKERAFRLFDQGRRPSDPEVRALGIKPNSAYRYYQIWKTACSHSQSRCDLADEA